MNELFSQGRCLFYEGDDPEGFRKQIQSEFGFDVANFPPGYDCFPPGKKRHNTWNVECGWRFHCPGEYYDAIYSERFPVGS